MSFPASSFDVKDRIRQAVDIVELARGYLDVRRQGRIYRAICPWHDDSRPSLQINAERQIFKCFVCDIGGDIFSFVMRMENVEFREALEILADRAGIALQPAGSTPGGDGHGKREMFQAAAWAEAEFHRCLLFAPEAEAARNYLQARGISEESIRRFCLGYSPDEWDWLVKKAKASSHRLETLERVGLANRKQQGSGYYDRFRGRLLFSIRDPQGRAVAMGGRTLPGVGRADAAKYINSPETPLFSKSALLYALDTAKESTIRSREIIVVEGYTDCILARQNGIENVVAVLGTALTDRHVPLLKRFADRVILVLDGDEAGQRRANEILEIFVAQQMDLRILTLPDGLDPCDFIRRHGADEFRNRLSGAIDALEHKVRDVTKRLDPAAGDHQANAALEEILATIAKARGSHSTSNAARAVRETQFLQRLARQFGISLDVLCRRLDDLRRRGSKPPSATAVENEPRRARNDVWERELLALLLCHPHLWKVADKSILPEWLREGHCRNIYELGCDSARNGRIPTFERLLLEFEDAETKQLLVELESSGAGESCEQPEFILNELTASFRRRRENRRAEQDNSLFQQRTLNEKEELELLLKIHRREQDRHGLPAPADG